MEPAHVLLALGGGAAVLWMVDAVRRREPAGRAASAVRAALLVVLVGGALALWPCGDGDCGALVPAWYAALAVLALLAVVTTVAARRRRSGPTGRR